MRFAFVSSNHVFLTGLAVTFVSLGFVATCAAVQPLVVAPGGEPGVRRAVILVTLAGDEEHAQRFNKIVEAWQAWLTESLDFPPQEVLILRDRERGLSATKDNITKKVKELVARTNIQDTLWVFVLGHADEVERRARLHLPGPDMNDMEFAALFAACECQDQLFWLTHTCSSHFLRALSRKGRIVISATAPDEGQNETEFPEALVDVIRRSPEELDHDGDGVVALPDVFEAVTEEVNARYAADGRVATEHAQLDDNGDARGTEAGDLVPVAADDDTPRQLRRDGAAATQIHLPWTTASNPPARSQDDTR
jgi:hypothetical protein